jgi:hypothetical protein
MENIFYLEREVKNHRTARKGVIPIGIPAIFASPKNFHLEIVCATAAKAACHK